MRDVSDLESELHELAARVGRLEETLRGDGAPRSLPARSDGPDTDDAPGSTPTGAQTVRYSGAVDLAGPVQWSIHYDAGAVLELPAESAAAVFAALGHPARLEIVRILLRGNASVTDIQAAGDFGTSGQLYHHLKILTAAAVVSKVGRSEYGIAATHVVPTLVALVSAADISGSL
jgi:DNA-binding transcriptional ArsR family regulator